MKPKKDDIEGVPCVPCAECEKLVTVGFRELPLPPDAAVLCGPCYAARKP